MRVSTLGTSVLFGLGTVMLAAPAALAAPMAGLTATPGGAEVFITADGSPQAGEDIEVVVRCAGEVGAPGSPILQIGELNRIDTPAGIPTYVAPATIVEGTEPGDYPLVASCDRETLSNTITVQPPDRSGGEVFIIADGSPQAGEDIEVAVRCWGEFGTPESPVLQVGKLVEVEAPADIPTYVGPATIDRDAAPGDYPLTAECDGETLSSTITVYPSGGDNGDGDGTDGGDGDQVTRTPRGAPETGGDPGDGPSPLLLGAVGLAGIGALALRRVARR